MDEYSGAGELVAFGGVWAGAELRCDTEALEGLLTDDFHAVGPRGFPLDKKQWLERYDSGALVHDSFDWDDVEIRRYGDGAVALGIQSQQSVYEGRDMDGIFRVTQYLTSVPDGTWRLAALHLSPIAERPTG
ncbi:nuclear transport factor 2 family protein [Streptomyces iconiensis]|uniref:Nuclear transport factor 2 family protein n=1 Tax=Streptomyces iconiensis TaxID=1384038 RepID=A0ABT6ZR67_9ACTN|nr:nuclear transport factor 2 family protein [Streptomyces iconiensis]MDJ1131550.1 nuclear transport factor 2 family protein [Streptomyces iconiensis]